MCDDEIPNDDDDGAIDPAEAVALPYCGRLFFFFVLALKSCASAYCVVVVYLQWRDGEEEETFFFYYFPLQCDYAAEGQLSSSSSFARHSSAADHSRRRLLLKMAKSICPLYSEIWTTPSLMALDLLYCRDFFHQFKIVTLLPSVNSDSSDRHPTVIARQAHTMDSNYRHNKKDGGGSALSPLLAVWNVYLNRRINLFARNYSHHSIKPLPMNLTVAQQQQEHFTPLDWLFFFSIIERERYQGDSAHESSTF